MKRLAVALPELASRDNLALATWKAARGKHERPSVAAWLASLDQNLARLADSILEGRAPSGRALRFVIHDPKRREITAACFADRVLHHAILNLTEPRFEQALAPGVYACRTGRGVHAAVAAVQRGLQQHPWVVQVDVDGYFPSIDHAVLRALLARRFKGDAFLRLLDRVIEAGAVQPGRGLPIGALTSQHFANAYLSSGDRLLEGFAGVHAPLRYMDDMLWFCSSRQVARDSLDALRAHLHDELKLRLKSGVVLRPSAEGTSFCGVRVKPGGVWPGRRKRQRFTQAVCRLQAAEAAGASQAELQRAHDISVAALLPACSTGLRGRMWWPAAEPAGAPHQAAVGTPGEARL